MTPSVVEKRPGDPKRFEFVKGDGTDSKPVNLRKTMLAVDRQVKVGDGPFTVIRGGKYHHPNLNREDARAVTKEILKAIPIDSGVVTRNVKEQKVFQAQRVPTNPYMDPFRDAHMTPARINGGVDYCIGAAPGHRVYALGRAIITQVGIPSHTSTFGNELSIYQLLEGQAKGKFVFFAEHYNIVRQFHVGQLVDTDTVLYLCDGCIEIGWSDGHGSMAWDINSNIEGQRTVWGQNFSDLLESTGCQPGLTQGLPLTMSLPAGWPTDWSEVG